MAATDEKKSKSLKNMLKSGMMAILIALIFYIIFYNFYSVLVFQGQIQDSNRRTISICAESIENQLNSIDNFMINMIANNTEFKLLSSKTTPLNLHVWSWQVLQNMKNQLMVSGYIKGLFLYSAPNAAYYHTASPAAPVNERFALTEYMENMFRFGEIPLSSYWEPVLIGEKYYLLHIMGEGGVYMGGLLDFEDVTVDMWTLGIEDDYTIVYYDKNGVALTHREWIEEEGVKFPGGESKNYLFGRSGGKQYWVYTRTLSKAEVGMAALLPGGGFFYGLNALHVVIFCVSVLLIALIPLLYYKLKTTVLTPLDNITESIRMIGDGREESMRPEQYPLTEFVEIGDTVNNMLEQIRELRIESYERQLESQMAQLQYLQLQIRPHFFLNSLKSVYAMAENGETAEIQEMILGLSSYFRYIFRDNLQLIPLRDELNHAKNYILLQKLNTRSQPICNINVEQRALSCSIPPLTIQTFVENAVYHAAKPGVQLRIDIRLEILEHDEGRLLDITVSDNGDGFPPDVLKRLNSPEDEVYRDKHVGIHNVRLRIKSIYGKRAELFFFNSGKGAVSEIILPVDEGTES